MLISLNKFWSVKISEADRSVVLCRDGREFRSYNSTKELVDATRKFVSNVDPDAYVKVLLWHHEADEESDVAEVPAIKVGYWLNPEQLAEIPR